MASDKQKLAQQRNWEVFQLKGCLARITNCINIAYTDPEHRGLLALYSIRTFLNKAIREIKGQTEES